MLAWWLGFSRAKVFQMALCSSAWLCYAVYGALENHGLLWLLLPMAWGMVWHGQRLWQAATPELVGRELGAGVVVS